METHKQSMPPFLPIHRTDTVVWASPSSSADNAGASSGSIQRVKTQKPNNMLVRYLTDEQEAILLNHLPPHYHGIVLTALNTGLRQGELLRLTWADIDWNVGVLTVNETKAGERRRVPMNSTVVSVLTELKASGPTGEEPIFTHTARYLRRAFDKSVKTAGLTPFRFHDLRHTFASRLAM
jgi:integrase